MGQPIQEPSMEDILASIKRIIDEEGSAQPPPPARSRARPVAVPDPVPVPEETGMTVDGEEVPAPDTEPVAEPQAAAAEEEGEPDVLELTSPIGAPGWQPAILSATAEQASRSAFQALSRLQLREAETAPPATLEGLVAEMLRPMLRDWLDRELPAIVERIVTAEVRRLSGQG